MCCANFYLVQRAVQRYISTPKGEFHVREMNTISMSYATKTRVSESTNNGCKVPTR